MRQIFSFESGCVSDIFHCRYRVIQVQLPPVT